MIDMHTRMIVAEVPHRGRVSVYEVSLGRLREDAFVGHYQRGGDPDHPPETIEECAAVLGRDLAALDVWQESDAAQLEAQEPTAQRHGDPIRTLEAKRIARRIGWIASKEVGT